MSYSGFLLKIGDYEIDDGKYIKAESYSPYVNMQDLDPWTDTNGYAHRNAVKLKSLKVEFETPAMLTDKDIEILMTNIRKQFIKPDGRECYITAYIPEQCGYVTQYGYMPDFQPTIYSTAGGIIRYNPIRLAFVGGVYHA